ncbi:MAG: methylenetetrahydrofolate reductase [NAD(P)H] [Phycisphaerales bacterium]|nr:methylenetetrahydrofolate reductase [NAD(P)H] [Phycisphaerales bacterium]
MHIADIFERDRVTASFEFFPPRTDSSWSELFATIADFENLTPSFVSVTYGAGGSTRERTNDLVLRLKRETALDPVPHLTCVGHTAAEIEGLLRRYCEGGVSNILALRGDAPLAAVTEVGEFAHAADLVKAIRKFGENGSHHDRRGFGIGVAGFPEGHPDTPNTLVQMDHLKAKVDQGADWICSQLFFDNRAFFDWQDRCDLAGIKLPTIAGIMPITSIAGLKRMADLAAGVVFPAPLLRSLRRAQDDPAAVERVGIHWATEQCRDLIDRGVRGLHFYTLNKSATTRGVFASLGVRNTSGLKH